MHEHTHWPDWLCDWKASQKLTQRLQLVLPFLHRKKNKHAQIQSTARLVWLMQTQHNMHGHKLCPNKLLYPLQYFCIKQTVSLWTLVCCKAKSPQQFSVAHCEPLFCHILAFLLSSPWAVTPPQLLLFYTIHHFLSLFSFPVFHPSFSLSIYLPPPLSPSLPLWPLCLPLSCTHVGLIELEDPALIKGWVWSNASKPLRLQSRTG